MRLVFIDSSPLYSLNSLRDQSHQKSKELLQKLQEGKIGLLTTDYVIEETATTLIMTKKGGYNSSVNFLDWVFNTQNQVRIEWINKKHFYKAMRIFKTYNKDKLWSFTDCTSYVVMKGLKIDTAFTFDERFKQMGFKIL